MISKKTEKFINKSNKIHNNKYDYSKTLFIKSSQKVSIICKKHGVFEQYPSNHLKGCGCNKCGIEKTNINNKLKIEEVLNRFKNIHGNKYIYDNINYSNIHQKINIICREHGKFLQTPSNHMMGKGCPKCNQIIQNDLKRSNTHEFINKSKFIHGDIYEYDKVHYYKSSFKVDIYCKKHGIFKITPNNHLKGHGCPKCISISSKPEIELQNFIKSIGYNILTNVRDIISPNELDIFIPFLNKAIEFNGMYWHYSKIYFIPGDHAIKSNMCRQKGIKLLHLREDLWKKDKEKMKKVIEKFLYYKPKDDGK